MIRIKLGGVTNLSDARYAAAVGIHYIGFCFDPESPDYIPPVKAKEMMDWLSGSHLVAEFGDQSLKEIDDLCEILPVSAVQVNNRLLPDELKTIGKALIKKIDLGLFGPDALQTELQAYAPVVDAFLLSADTDVLGFRSSELIGVCASFNVMLDAPLTPENVLSFLDTYRPYAINLTGGSEERPGLKDFDELNRFVDLLLPQD